MTKQAPFAPEPRTAPEPVTPTGSGKAVLILPDGTCTAVDFPGKRDTLHAMYHHLECATVELVRLDGGVDMWIDEEGKFAGPAIINNVATMLAKMTHAIASWDVIVGRALLTSSAEADTIPLSEAQLAVFSALLIDARRKDQDR